MPTRRASVISFSRRWRTLSDSNYSMFEATRVPRRWVAHNLRHDLVVVPTASSRHAWLESGFPADRIRLCPLGVDPGRFRPDAEPSRLTDASGRLIRDYRVRVLNVSEPGPRKNLAALLRVWITISAMMSSPPRTARRASSSRTAGYPK